MTGRKKRELVNEDQLCLPIELPEKTEPDIKVQSPEYPIWTKNKAKLIQKYLKYFCMITKHGTYIDGFAGPQRIENLEVWSAKLVLQEEERPKLLKNFYLYEQDTKKINLLKNLKEACLAKDEIENWSRNIEIEEGDCNSLIPDLLKRNVIKPKEATFCLLDQRTFECHWSTVKALAEYPKSEYKIEIFYFLAESWLDRSLKSIKDTEKVQKWWGKEDWEEITKVKLYDRASLVCKRFSSELGYRSVKPWAIYSKEDGCGGRIYYFMIHATDHPQAPELMSRAYRQTVTSRTEIEQLKFNFEPSEDCVVWASLEPS